MVSISYDRGTMTLDFEEETVMASGYLDDWHIMVKIYSSPLVRGNGPAVQKALLTHYSGAKGADLGVSPGLPTT